MYITVCSTLIFYACDVLRMIASVIYSSYFKGFKRKIAYSVYEKQKKFKLF